ncbi:putative E3 ubiquitin-protein ligase [Arachis hypogaea]|nr:putative E3 ubiquitin-protein ligase [Arachis hypogaea]
MSFLHPLVPSMDTSYEMEPFLFQNESPHHEVEEEDEYSIIAAAEIKESPPPSSSSSTPQSSCFTTLTDSDIRKLQTTEINKVSSVLLIPQSDACLLLIHHGWSAMKVHEAWFEDEQRVRELVGLLNSSNNINHWKELIQSSTCEICFDDSVWYKKVEYAKCGHGYCIDCWKHYIDEKIQEGPHECLKPMRCPHPSCEASLEIETVRRFASETNKNMYDRFLLRSYVETRKNIKWCPSPACDLAVLYESDGNYANKYVEACCSNEHRFCWECGEDGHRPVSCETVAEWMKKNVDDSQSVIWISAFTKECPDCGIRIEKNEGCMQMICTVCGCRFCWLCLSRWSLCSAYGCNRFSARNTETPTMDNGNGYLDLERYTHYYERWFTNEFSRKKSIEMMEKYLNNENIRILCKEFERREDDFEFVKKAWEEVIECRKLLKWTYAYGYFIPEEEKAKKELFEHTQGVAESALEKLHKFAETMLMEILNRKKDGFDRNRLELSHLTVVTKNFFDNMVTQLEDRGLDDVNVKSYGESSRSSSLSSWPRGVVRDGMTEIGLRKCGYCGYYNLASTLECPCIEKKYKYQCWICSRDPPVIWCPLRMVN